MFEQEIEMEQQQSSVVPLLLIVAMILAIVGVAAYYVVQNGKVLPASEAVSLVEQTLNADGPQTIHFETGNVVASVQERPNAPNYRLLEKAGLLTLGKDNGHFTPVQLTPAGKKLLSEIKGVTNTKDSKGTSDLHIVPIAGRRLVGSPKVTMTGMGRGTIEFMWAWEPNRIGDLFDASGSLVKSFNTWDRGMLIDKYGAKFYHGEPTTGVVNFARSDKGTWQLVTE